LLKPTPQSQKANFKKLMVISLQIRLPLAAASSTSKFKGADCLVTITTKGIKAGLKNQPPLLAGDFPSKVPTVYTQQTYAGHL
jgi:hypothetical protein